MGALIVSVFLIHFVMLLTFSFIPESSWQTNARAQTSLESVSVSPSPSPRPVNQGPPVVILRVFAAILGLFILLGWIFGALTIYAGRCVQRREHRMFIYIMAGLNCALIPWGTLLGVCTFIVLQTPVARREFGLPAQGS
jgi:hypothetical protein